ncbi:nitroreductase family protein [Gorillibacterium sp. CAU 1737]|uniref:nitroreductase family protein n=1 Tax=Gorillibacterium sp. CAU 1737 TaxID=3140362 RepID=UPI003260D1CD
MGEVSAIVKERRSAMKFQPDVRISNEELEELFQLVKFAPSAFNLQHTHYLVVTDPKLKEAVYEAANQQYKVKTASAAIVVLGDLDAYQQVGELHQGLLQLGVINKQEYDLTVESVTRFYEEGGEAVKHDEAIRNSSLSAMLFMLVAKDKGWDTCPMIGFDPQKLKDALNLPDRMVPALLITIGKEDTTKQRPRGYRKPVSEFVSYNTL